MTVLKKKGNIKNFLVINSVKRVLPVLKVSQTHFQVALVYMSSRLFVNTAQVYLPFYLQETFLKKFENLALIPLLMYIGSIGATLGVHRLNKNFGRKVSYCSGKFFFLNLMTNNCFNRNSLIILSN